MTAPLGDRKLEAAAQIDASVLSRESSDAGVLQYSRDWALKKPGVALAMLSTAIRETHAAELAEALEEAVRQLEYLHSKFAQTGSGNSVIARCSRILASYKEIVSG